MASGHTSEHPLFAFVWFYGVINVISFILGSWIENHSSIRWLAFLSKYFHTTIVTKAALIIVRMPLLSVCGVLLSRSANPPISFDSHFQGTGSQWIFRRCSYRYSWSCVLGPLIRCQMMHLCKICSRPNVAELFRYQRKKTFCVCKLILPCKSVEILAINLPVVQPFAINRGTELNKRTLQCKTEQWGLWIKYTVTKMKADSSCSQAVTLDTAPFSVFILYK